MVPYTWRNTLEAVLVLDNDREMIILGGIENAGLERKDWHHLYFSCNY